MLLCARRMNTALGVSWNADPVRLDRDLTAMTSTGPGATLPSWKDAGAGVVPLIDALPPLISMLTSSSTLYPVTVPDTVRTEPAHDGLKVFISALVA